MKRLLPFALGGIAALVALVIWWPSSPDHSDTVHPSEEEVVQDEPQEAPAVADLDAGDAVENERKLVAARGAQGAGIIENLLVADGPTGIRAIDANGETLAPATFLVRPSSSRRVEWIDSPTGELRLEELTSVRSVAAFAAGSWSDPTVLDHAQVRHEQVNLLVHRPAASMSISVTVAGIGSDAETSCRYEYRPGPSEGASVQFIFGNEEIIEWDSSVDSSGLGADYSLFGDAFSVYAEKDPRAEVVDGLLQVDELPAGWYYLTAQSKYGVTEDRSVELRSGTNQAIDFELVEGGFVTGRVVQVDGTPVKEAWVGGIAKSSFLAEFMGTEQLLTRARTYVPNGRNAAYSDENGEYRFGPLTPGETIFVALGQDYLPTRFADVEVLPSQDLQLPEAFLRQGHSLAVLVREAETGVVLSDEALVRWRPAGDERFGNTSEWNHVEDVDQAGRFIPDNLPFRPIEVEARAPGYGAQRQQYVIAERDWIAGMELPQIEFLLEPGATIRGTVLDADGEPVVGAEVLARLSGTAANPWEFLADRNTDDERTSLTDETGGFLLEDLPAESWTLLAQASGHARGMSKPIDLTDQTFATVEIRLPRPAKVTVQYRGQPGATLRGHTAALTELASATNSTASTDELGQAVFEDLPPGEYSLQLIPGGIDAQALVEGSFATQIVGFELTAGESKEIEVGPGLADASLQGQLTRDGLPVEGLSVSLLGGSGINVKRTDQDGRFAFDELIPGTHSWFVGRGQMSSIAGEVQVESGENELKIELPGGGLEVTVVSAADGAPLSGTPVTATIDNSLGNPLMASTDSNGVARFEFMEAGVYRLAAGRASMPILGGDEAYGASFQDITIGSGSQQIELRLEESATFRVRVLDLNGDPLAGASMFYLREDGQPLSSFSMNATNSKGVAQLTGLPAGPGRILVRHPSAGQKEFPVELTAGDLSKREIQLEDGVTVYLKINDASGEPATGVLAVLRDDRDVRITMIYSMQDAQAVNTAVFSGQEQRLGPVAPGRYTLEVFRLGGDTMTQELTVPAGGSEFRRTVVYRPQD